jgi:hypothetical protein
MEYPDDIWHAIAIFLTPADLLTLSQLTTSHYSRIFTLASTLEIVKQQDILLYYYFPYPQLFLVLYYGQPLTMWEPYVRDVEQQLLGLGPNVSKSLIHLLQHIPDGKIEQILIMSQAVRVSGNTAALGYNINLNELTDNIRYPDIIISNPLPNTKLDNQILLMEDSGYIYRHISEAGADDADWYGYYQRRVVTVEYDKCELCTKIINADWPDSEITKMIQNHESPISQTLLKYRPWLIFPYTRPLNYRELTSIQYPRYLPTNILENIEPTKYGKVNFAQRTTHIIQHTLLAEVVEVLLPCCPYSWGSITSSHCSIGWAKWLVYNQEKNEINDKQHPDVVRILLASQRIKIISLNVQEYDYGILRRLRELDVAKPTVYVVDLRQAFVRRWIELLWT